MHINGEIKEMLEKGQTDKGNSDMTVILVIITVIWHETNLGGGGRVCKICK